MALAHAHGTATCPGCQAEIDRLRAICIAHDTDPEGCTECFVATIEGREPGPLPHGITPEPEHGDVLRRALGKADG